jgi:GNAT superfamily N-acetyltransferase
VTSSSYAIRPVRPDDVPAVVRMVHELAEYERAPEQCHLTVAQLNAALFTPNPALYGHIGVDADGRPHGFALWFLHFSTWQGVHGIYLEDLYVDPAARGTGLGRDLLATLARISVERGYGRLDWSVLDWNPARQFYEAIGATPVDNWVRYRLDGPALAALADRAPAPGPTPSHAPATTPGHAGTGPPDPRAVDTARPSHVG